MVFQVLRTRDRRQVADAEFREMPTQRGDGWSIASVSLEYGVHRTDNRC